MTMTKPPPFTVAENEGWRPSWVACPHAAGVVDRIREDAWDFAEAWANKTKKHTRWAHRRLFEAFANEHLFTYEKLGMI